jgi:hypothetical protein
MEPPVSKNEPAGFKAATLALMATGPKTCDGPACPSVPEIVNERFFADGPSIKATLSAFDGRLAEMESRAKDKDVPCLEKSGVALSVQMTGTQTASMTLNCSDKYSGPAGSTGEGLLGLGQAGGITYVWDRFGAPNESMGAILGWQDGAQNVEVYRIGGKLPTAEGSIFHLKSTAADGVIEVAVGAAKDSGTGLGCGTQYRSNADLIYVSGKLTDPGMADAGDDCSGATALSVCMSATDFGVVDTSQCQTAGLTTFTLPALTFADVDSTAIWTAAAQDFSATVPQFDPEDPKK